jgi:hypothetical protein
MGRHRRKETGVKRLPWIRRICLKCNRAFWARGRFNRLCELCKELNRQLADGDYTSPGDLIRDFRDKR